jgi:Uma2 family endonuclease
MTQQLAAPELTYEEFVRLHERARQDGLGVGYELDEEGLFLMTALEPLQSHLVGMIDRQLGGHIDARGLGELFPDCFLDLGRSPKRWYYPDFTFLSNDDLQRFDGRRIPVPPTAIIEVSVQSSLARDMARKNAVYHRAGVPWYWIFNTVDREILEYRHASDHYELVSRQGLYEPFRPVLFPELTIQLRPMIPRLP